MKKKRIAVCAAVCLFFLTSAGCGRQTADPGNPPEEVLHPESSPAAVSQTEAGKMMEKAVTVRIGRDGGQLFDVDMVQNDAVNTMLGYLSGDGLLFPTYTYEEEEGYVAQVIRGSYTKEADVTITEIHAGELYLFSGGQLRLYFKDIPDVSLTATPVGIFEDSASVEDAVIDAYESNKGDTWGVDVYFWIKKNQVTGGRI